MAGKSIDDDWELGISETRTVLLVGRTGNGKSATGNSILGRKAFKSRSSASAVTSTCQMQSTVLSDGQLIINVIDTPGLFDVGMGSDLIVKEIVKCIGLAKEGIHAILIVFSIRNRFSEEEQASFRDLQTLFGSKIVDYIIPIFTGGDELEDNDETFEDYLNCSFPEPLKEILAACKNRHMVFDNKTKDDRKRSEQVQQLLSLVNMVMTDNGGQPYMDELFAELREGAIKLHNQQKEVEAAMKGSSKSQIKEMKELMHQTYDEQLKRITVMVETKLREATTKLEQQLAEEQAARLQAEANALIAQKKSDAEIQKLRRNLEMAQEELDKKGSSNCAIL